MDKVAEKLLQAARNDMEYLERLIAALPEGGPSCSVTALIRQARALISLLEFGAAD
ncbi:hypothetical protein [Roseomonas marmotae]|uniref:Uncharacterized protein n=1 Tax=Roseomonas marmotae TaxID=2768161 RepID=A0ABS3K9U4_9PROT|nr:hypothetical protein [Roseomonas marmotae]MBO1073787.1 hypothetical protein [Roseomonas marmotae]QTI78583.1 hypothetical protein IAI58_12985 [Roseomonas marmotae]